MVEGSWVGSHHFWCQPIQLVQVCFCTEVPDMLIDDQSLVLVYKLISEWNPLVMFFESLIFIVLKSFSQFSVRYLVKSTDAVV